MSTQWIQYLTGFAAVFSWLIAGVFMAFSDFVMKSLGALPAAQGVAAMQSINVLVYRSIFMFGLFFVAAASLAFLGLGYVGEGSVALSAAAIIYLVAVMGGSFVGNIPLNNQLAAVNPESGAAAALWRRYLRRWGLWNHLRALGAGGAALLMTLAALDAV